MRSWSRALSAFRCNTAACAQILVHMCPHTRTHAHMCPHTRTYVSSYSYTCTHVSSYSYICPHTRTYAPSGGSQQHVHTYSCICVLILLHMHTCVLILLYVSSYSDTCAFRWNTAACGRPASENQHTPISVLILVHMRLQVEHSSMWTTRVGEPGGTLAPQVES
jgi:hypothetical protein